MSFIVFFVDLGTALRRALAFLRRHAFTVSLKAVLITFIWVYALRGAYAAPDEPAHNGAVATRALSRIASENINDSLLMVNLHAANAVSSAFTETLVYDFKSASVIENILLE